MLNEETLHVRHTIFTLFCHHSRQHLKNPQHVYSYTTEQQHNTSRFSTKLMNYVVCFVLSISLSGRHDDDDEKRHEDIWLMLAKYATHPLSTAIVEGIWIDCDTAKCHIYALKSFIFVSMFSCHLTTFFSRNVWFCLLLFTDWCFCLIITLHSRALLRVLRLLNSSIRSGMEK